MAKSPGIFKVRRVLLWCLGFLYGSWVLLATAITLSETYQVKAAFIYNFTKFVEWPAHVFANTPAHVLLCIPDETVIRQAFASLEGKNVQGRRLLLKPLLTFDDIKACHILFMRVTPHDDSSEKLRVLQYVPVLTIGEGENMLPYGGIIHFLIVEDKIRFVINAEAARQAGLSISSKLLQLAYQQKS